MVGGLNTCRQRFDLNRQGLFHYVLYVHTRAISKSSYPCLDASSPRTPVPFQEDGSCAVLPNPGDHIPRSVSGVAELPGRYVMVSLGQWDNFVGTDYMQASTTVHELGHNVNLGHGGKSATFTNLANGRASILVEPNCKPNYFSVMNYAYQAAGLRRNSGPAEVDLSNVVHGLTADGKVNEANVFDGLLTPAAVYRSAWYVLLTPGTLGETLGIQAAKKHCDGSVLQPGEPGTVPGAPGVGRVDATTVSSLIDWRGDGGTTTSGAQDVNFDGIQGTLDGFDDWSAVRLNQVGAGRNMAGMSIGMEWGGVDWNGVDWNGVDWNGVDWNGVDWNGVDWNGVDWNGVDWNGVDWNGVDWNGVDWNGVDWNGVDWNGVDWNGVDWNGVANGAELDRRTAIDSGGGTAPNDLKAFVRGTDGAGGSHASVPPGETWVPPGEPANCTTLGADQCHQVRLDWSAGHVGPPTSYAGLRVWDSTGTADIPAGGSVAVPVGTTSNGNTTTLNDTEELPNGKRFIYFARATIDGALRSASNFAIVTAENSAPVASNDSYSVPTTGPRTISGNVLNNDADQDSPAAMSKAVTRQWSDRRHTALQRRRFIHLHGERDVCRNRQVHLQGEQRDMES